MQPCYPTIIFVTPDYQVSGESRLLFNLDFDWNAMGNLDDILSKEDKIVKTLRCFGIAATPRVLCDNPATVFFVPGDKNTGSS